MSGAEERDSRVAQAPSGRSECQSLQMEYCGTKETHTYAGSPFTKAARIPYRSHAWTPSVAGFSDGSQCWCRVVDSDERNKYPPGA
jgi:hypothetical protein